MMYHDWIEVQVAQTLSQRVPAYQHHVAPTYLTRGGYIRQATALTRTDTIFRYDLRLNDPSLKAKMVLFSRAMHWMDHTLLLKQDYRKKGYHISTYIIDNLIITFAIYPMDMLHALLPGDWWSMRCIVIARAQYLSTRSVLIDCAPRWRVYDFSLQLTWSLHSAAGNVFLRGRQYQPMEALQRCATVGKLEIWFSLKWMFIPYSLTRCRRNHGRTEVYNTKAVTSGGRGAVREHRGSGLGSVHDDQNRTEK